MLLARVISAFSVPRLPKATEVRRRDALNQVVAQRSHGNIRLQKGKFYTTEDVDKQYERLKDKRFFSA